MREEMPLRGAPDPAERLRSRPLEPVLDSEAVAFVVVLFGMLVAACTTPMGPTVLAGALAVTVMLVVAVAVHAGMNRT